MRPGGHPLVGASSVSLTGSATVEAHSRTVEALSPATAEVSVVTVYDRKNIGDQGGAQNNFPLKVLLTETGYAYGVQTRGSPVEDGT
ncbi:hypothetical protein GCM10010521_49500 [Streptomyces rameus]|uniref:Uncharacterized protein n=1 Tax=Streptomyces rameus TaxID=68261 RepID=A0ABP6NQC1_9ACTN